MAVQIMVNKPGIYQWSSDEYHGDIHLPVPSLAAGIADSLVNQTPLHAWTRHRRLNPNYVEEVNDTFDAGKAAHSILLEGENTMEVMPYDDWRTKAAREAKEAAREAGKVPMLAKHASRVMRMVEAARTAFERCEDLRGYAMATGSAEQSYAWKESNSGPILRDGVPPNQDIWLRCRPDWVSPDRKIMMDAKFTDTDAGPASFSNQIVRMAYDLRGSFYLRGNTALGGNPEAVYLFLVQEARAPYATSFIALPPAYVELGNRKVERAIELWRECMATNVWPGYPNRILYPDPPPWAMSQWDDRKTDNLVLEPFKDLNLDNLDV